MKCHKCDSVMPAGARFCPSCGSAHIDICPACGMRVDNPQSKVCASCGMPLKPRANAAESPGRAQPDASFGWANVERRQLAILSGDLVGSVALSRGLDPEDFGLWMGRYQAFCTQAVARYGGYAARFIGDGMLAYFGYPQAHEDDPERAVRAALELVAGVPAITVPGAPALAVRVGVATGLVVVGEISRGAAGFQEEVFGETPAFAARLQSMADANTVLIDESTRRRIGGLFHLTDLGRREAKGVDGGLETWRVEGLASESRFDALRANAPGRLVGREAELALLLDRWAAARSGEGQVVLVRGEAGIGKSALLHAFDDRLEKESQSRVTLTLSCVQYHKDTALYPVLAHLERAASFELADSEERKVAKLATLIERLDSMPPHSLPLIADALRLPVPRDDALARTTPQRRKEDTLAALVAYVRLHAKRQPLVLRIEDAQWIDPTTQELLAELVEEVRGDRILVVITARPGTDLGWPGEAHVSEIVLNRLSRPYAARLIGALARRDLPPSIVEEIIHKSDGVPLYLEELLTAVLASSLALERVVSNGEAQISVPSTLQGSLLERLDRIPGVKDVAHVCAVIGKSFSPRLVAAILPADEARLPASLEQLVQAGLLSRRRELNERSFTFKHVLMQQAIYDSILVSRRRDLHARIAHAMEAIEPEGFRIEPSILAHHYAQAQQIEPAIKYLREAGQQAMRQSAVIEAAALIGRALTLLGTTPRSAARDRLEIELQIAMGQALIAGKGIAFPDVSMAFDRARVLCDELGDSAALFPIMLAQCRSHQLRGELRAAAGVAQDFVKRAASSSEVTVRAMAHRCMGLVCYHDGRLAASIENFEAALALYNPDDHAAVSFQLVNNPRIVCCLHLGGLKWATGRESESDHYLAAAEDEIAKRNDPFDAAGVLLHGGLRQVFRRDAAAALPIARRFCALTEELGYAQFHAMGLIYLGWARALLGEANGGCEDIERGLGLYRRTGASLNVSLYETLMADALTAAGQPAKAMDHLDRAIRRTEETTESTCGFAAEIHRLAASIIASQSTAGDPAVIAELDRAIEIAQVQGGVAWEARALRDLATHLQRAGREEEAARRINAFTRRLGSAHDGPDLRAIRRAELARP